MPKAAQVLNVEMLRSVPCSLSDGQGTESDFCVSPSEVDKVLSGLEILSKVFDQQSSPMVTRLLQQQVGLEGGLQEVGHTLELHTGLLLRNFVYNPCFSPLRAYHRLESKSWRALC